MNRDRGRQRTRAHSIFIKACVTELSVYTFFFYLLLHFHFTLICVPLSLQPLLHSICCLEFFNWCQAPKEKWCDVTKRHSNEVPRFFFVSKGMSNFPVLQCTSCVGMHVCVCKIQRNEYCLHCNTWNAETLWNPILHTHHHQRDKIHIHTFRILLDIDKCVATTTTTPKHETRFRNIFS